MAPAVSAEAAPVTPLSFLIKGITDFANGAASAIDSQGAASSIGRRLQQAPQQPQPQPQPQPQAQPQPQVQSFAQQQQEPAAGTGYHNPKPLIQIEPHMIIDQKNQKAFATGGDIVFANGQRIPLPGGFDLPTRGLWHQLLDIPQVMDPHQHLHLSCTSNLSL
jgi:hypothetical protein